MITFDLEPHMRCCNIGLQLINYKNINCDRHAKNLTMLKRPQSTPCTSGTSPNSKMASGGGSIASELLDAIKLKNYGIYVNKLNSSDEIRVSEFHASVYALEYVLDTRIFSMETKSTRITCSKYLVNLVVLTMRQ